MSEHDKNFYSLEELQRTRDNLEGYLDGEEVYYFVGTIRYAYDEIERLNNIINELEKWLKEQKDINDRTNSIIFNARGFEDKQVLNKLQELKDSDSNE